MDAAYRQICNSVCPPADPKVSFQGKNVIVTGGNTGLGLEAAVKFVNLGAAKVIITARDMEKGTAAKSQIDTRTNRGDCVQVWHLDMDSYASIRNFARCAAFELDHLDVVILSAGVAPRRLRKAPTGWESTLQINVLSTALLGLLLLPKLQSSITPDSIPRLELVGARAHESITLTQGQRNATNVLESFNISEPEDFKPLLQYAVSKLFLIYIMKALASMTTSSYGEPNVVVTSVCPGACKSDLARDYDSGMFKMLKSTAGALVLKTAEEGARTYIIGVTAGKEAHGRFIQHADIRPPSPMVADEEGERLQKKVWGEILEALRKDVPEVAEIASQA